ncbi:TadE/TadG family type IV pilus assembly protein [Acidocella aromatica]|uniref:Flp pilus assembly protein TadG n=1 Tax=Acidocella aromatica TaxID=1303579 RepID=A0A840VMY3_9PROT|nr:TadE/TadG family type IV pilus assembly protein [Acidocella aromatica]MBB5373539.1 Flp pilus assembly protein TadG [Acidocella aromatica]
MRALPHLGRRGSVTVEFALIATFFLLPLFGGSLDMVEYISARAQLNTALQALYYYALTNPSAGTNSANTTAIMSLMSSSLHPLTLVSSSVSYNCIANSATTVTYVSQSSTAITSCPASGSYTASQQTLQITVTYTVRTSVPLTMPMPFVPSNPLVLTQTGMIQVQ